MVESALKVLNSGNAELIQLVETGKLKASSAARKLRPPRPAPPPAPVPAGEAISYQ